MLPSQHYTVLLVPSGLVFGITSPYIISSSYSSFSSILSYRSASEQEQGKSLPQTPTGKGESDAAAGHRVKELALPCHTPWEEQS